MNCYLFYLTTGWPPRGRFKIWCEHPPRHLPFGKMAGWCICRARPGRGWCKRSCTYWNAASYWGRINVQLYIVYAQIKRIPHPQLSMLHPCVADEGSSFKIWKVAVSILNVQLQTVNKELLSDMEVWQGADSICHKKTACYEMLHRASEQIISWTVEVPSASQESLHFLYCLCIIYIKIVLPGRLQLPTEWWMVIW
jgi:hypothetical protein